MSENVVSSVSSGAAKAATPNDQPIIATSGKGEPRSGKTSPAQAATTHALNLDEVVEKLNVRSRSVGTTLRFRVDLVSGISVIQVLDRDTGELIRQIPPRQISALATGNADAELQILDDLA